MKKLALISAVVFTTLTLHSCRQSDEIWSPEEAATLQKVQDSTNNIVESKNSDTVNIEQSNQSTSLVDGEILPPPKK